MASRVGGCIVVDIIDYTNQPSGSFKYVMLAMDVFSRHVWAKAMTANTGASITQTSKSLAADIGPMKEVNGDTEFEQTKALQTFLGSNNIAFKGNKGVTDLALLDSNMGNLKSHCQRSATERHNRQGCTFEQKSSRASTTTPRTKACLKWNARRGVPQRRAHKQEHGIRAA